MRALPTGIAFVCLSYIIGIIQIYSLYRFTSMRSLLIITKRFPLLVITESILVIIWLFFLAPFWFNSLLHVTDFGIPSAAYFLYNYGGLLGIPIVHAIACIEVCRLWLVSYNLHYLHSSQNEKWKSQIDHTFTEKDWYLKNRKTYGNKKYIIIRVFVYYLCVVSTVLIMFKINLKIGAMVDGLFYLVYVSAVVYIFYKCRKYKELNDKLLFYYEFRVTAVVWSCNIFMFFILAFINSMGFSDLYSILIMLNALVAWCVPSLLSTFLIPRKICLMDAWSDDLLSNNSTTLTKKVIEMNNFNNKDKQSNEPTVETKLYDTLKNEAAFELFIQFMYREFSSEAVLCFIQMVQFKEHLVESIGNETAVSEYKYINLLYDNIPKSAIVYDDNQQLAHSLYEKYIKYDSEFEVNLPANVRMKYIRLDATNWNMEKNDFINVFDPLINEMFLFMRNSFVRYEQL